MPFSDSPCLQGRAPLRPASCADQTRTCPNSPCLQGRAPLRHVIDRPCVYRVDAILPASKAGPHCGAVMTATSGSGQRILPASKAGPHCGIVPFNKGTFGNGDSPCLQGRAPLRQVPLGAAGARRQILPASKAGPHCGANAYSVELATCAFSLPPRQGPIAASRAPTKRCRPPILPASKAGPHCGGAVPDPASSSTPDSPCLQGRAPLRRRRPRPARPRGQDSPCLQGRAPLRHAALGGAGRARLRILPASKAGPHCGPLTCFGQNHGAWRFSLPPRQGPIAAYRAD